MTGNATITFSQEGVQPPVYVVTSLSEPPWATLMLTPAEETSSGNLVFKRQFQNVPEGSHQYKIRIGEGHWVIDESKDSATDEQGNRNNVLHVQATTDSDASMPQIVEENDASKKVRAGRADSTMDVRPVAPVPFVTVDKVTDKTQPEYGHEEPESLPEDASKRAADAKPDFERVRADTLSPTGRTLALDAEEDAAPLFRHESFQASETSPDAAGAESMQSSTDMSTGEAMNTPSETDSQEDELTLAPMLSHESGVSVNDEEADNHGGELDLAPLLSHESFSAPTNGKENLAEDEDDWGPQHYAYRGSQSKSFEPRRGSLLDDGLLPHERPSTGSFSGSDRSHSRGSIPDTTPSSRSYENEYAREIFGGGRNNFFRSNSSTLPHRIPKSDEEDKDLHDASLEAFPVGRDQILARVATIGNKLPEDETAVAPHSPVFSQACSSVDLAPVKSYTSLASVREDEEEEDEENNDSDSVSSPIYMSSSAAAFARDPLATPQSNESKQLGSIPEDKSEKPSIRNTEASELGSVDKTDGAMDSTKGKGPERVGAPATLSSTLTPPLTPEQKTQPLETELRQRREPAKHSDAGNLAPASPRQPEQAKTFMSSIVSFLSSCIGNRKQASVAAAFVIVAAYCWVTWG